MWNRAALWVNGLCLGGIFGYWLASGNSVALFGVPLIVVGLLCAVLGAISRRTEVE